MGGGGRGRLYVYRYTVTTGMTSAFRWATMRAVLIGFITVIDKVTGQCPQTTKMMLVAASANDKPVLA